MGIQRLCSRIGANRVPRVALLCRKLLTFPKEWLRCPWQQDLRKLKRPALIRTDEAALKMAAHCFDCVVLVQKVYLPLGRVHIDIHLVRRDLETNVKPWMAAFGQERCVEGFNALAQTWTVYQAIWKKVSVERLNFKQGM